MEYKKFKIFEFKVVNYVMEISENTKLEQQS